MLGMPADRSHGMREASAATWSGTTKGIQSRVGRSRLPHELEYTILDRSLAVDDFELGRSPSQEHADDIILTSVCDHESRISSGEVVCLLP